MKVKDDAGNWSKMSNVITHGGVTTGVEDSVNVTLSFSEPRPNPARSTATWAFALPRAADVQVDVFDVRGRLVQNIATGVRGPGNGEINWDLRDHLGTPGRCGRVLRESPFRSDLLDQAPARGEVAIGSGPPGSLPPVPPSPPLRIAAFPDSAWNLRDG
jgi:hypothetical protein